MENNLELRISAPGKLILFGEHSVVYGKTALAAGLKLRSQLILRELQNADCCSIEMPGVGLSIQLPVSRLQDDLLLPPDKEDGEGNDEDDPRLLERAREFVRSMDLEDPRQRCSLECTLYALMRVSRAEGLRRLPAPGGFLLRLTTELPLGAGLGSSASFSVCLAAGFLMWARIRSHHHDYDRQTLRQQVSRHAFGCERIMHGAPSGVDNEVCTFGSAIEFRRGEVPRQLPALTAELRLLLVDTRVARSTRLLVDKLAQLHAQNPPIFDAVFEAMDLVCRRAIDILGGGTNNCSEELSNLIDINQGLLTTCQVSHPSIDSICATAKKHGLSAKLTGAGGGGYVYILVPPNITADELNSVTSDLTANGFSVIETNVGGGDSGLDIYYNKNNNNNN